MHFSDKISTKILKQKTKNMATYKFYLADRTKNDGTRAIGVRVNIGNAHKQTSVGITINPRNWDAETQTVYGVKRADTYNRILADIKEQLDDLLDELALTDYQDDTAECKRILEIATKGKKKKRQTFYTAYQAVMTDERLKPRTRELYATTLKKIQSYCDSQGVSIELMRFEDITKTWINNFDRFLSTTCKSKNGRSIHLRNLRHVCNYGIQERLTTFYDWRGYSIKTTPTIHRAMSVEELRMFFNAKIERDKRQYLDMFKLTFYLIGINAADLLQAKKEQVINGRLEYFRAKTNRYYTIRIEPEAEEIINKYKGKGEYLLNVMDRYKNYRDYLHRLNDNLQKIGDCQVLKHNKKIRTPMFPAITTYWARHTWASIAAQLDIPNETIAAALGHGFGNRITAVYIDFDSKKVDEANRRVIDYVLTNKNGVPK